MEVRAAISQFIAKTPLAYLRVRVRAGPAKGAWWTLLPFSSNWRYGGEGDLAPGLTRMSMVRGASCWDFGGHFGIHAVGMAMQVGPTGEVATFEPDPIACRRLMHHVTLNRLANVRVFNAAASDIHGKAKMIVTHGLGSAMTHFRYDDEPLLSTTQMIEVPTVVPDELVRAKRVLPPDLIKLDVQGHGARAVRGSLLSITATRPVIVFSPHSQPELNGVREMLEPLGYACCALDGSSIGWGASGSEALLLLANR